MKKAISSILSIFIIAIITSISVNINFSKKQNFGNLALKNIEALARSEGGSESGKATCYTRASVNVHDEYLRCVECKYVSGTGITTGGYCRW